MSHHGMKRAGQFDSKRKIKGEIESKCLELQNEDEKWD